jgi:hypothetical protein
MFAYQLMVFRKKITVYAGFEVLAEVEYTAV